MNNTAALPAEQLAKESAHQFLQTIFRKALEHGYGEIEIRTFKPHPTQHFYNSLEIAAAKALEFSAKGLDAYFGVNPRTGNGGKKENIHFLTTFHAEIDYGTDGHKTEAKYDTYDQVLQAIRLFPKPPTIIVHSGGGFHCYWVLKEPLKVAEYGIEYLESINSGLLNALCGDVGTQDISRVLRVPETVNYKLSNNPRLVTLIENTGLLYDIGDFADIVKRKDRVSIDKDQKINNAKAEYVKEADICSVQYNSEVSIDSLNIPNKIKSLILNGNDHSYHSNSEADMAVITILVKKGYENIIKSIYQNTDLKIGEKYRGHSKPDSYLSHSINKAKEFVDLTEEELMDPLFLSGSIIKANKKYRLEITRFQEYMTRKYLLKIHENTFFKYNGRCYEPCSHEAINNLCQKELSNHRKLFTQAELSSFIHYSVGDILLLGDKACADQVAYLTLNNGLYSLSESRLLPHDENIFTTNQLPYDYNIAAQCPRFLEYLDEVFLKDDGKINFVQEAFGYALHKSIPMPAMFFLVGSGSNGKSVFLNVLSALYGEHNCSSISLSSLTNEYYIIDLFGKMINISSETPRKRLLNSDVIKAVVAGDTVTGRPPHETVKKFRPFAKHYLAMNETPYIDDPSHGMIRRIYIIDFPRTFPKEEMDTDLTAKLLKELPGIFNWALEGYQRLKQNKFKFTESQSVEKSRELYQNNIDSIGAFIKEFLSPSDSDSARIKFSDLYSGYNGFCYDSGYNETKGKREMREYLTRVGFTVKNSTSDGNQVFVYKISWKGNLQTDDQD